MKNKTKKKTKIMLKKIFTKNKLLVLKKYDRLMAYNIPYDLINRAYKRYLINIEDYIWINGYPRYWFKTDRVAFCNAVKTFIAAKKCNHEFKPYTHGYTNMEIVKLSGIDKYLP